MLIIVMCSYARWHSVCINEGTSWCRSADLIRSLIIRRAQSTGNWAITQEIAPKLGENMTGKVDVYRMREIAAMNCIIIILVSYSAI